MPSYIIKAKPDEDWYCLWSTIVDAPCQWGTRGEMERMSYDRREVAPERFDRADKNGTSAAWPNWPDERQPFGWTDESFIIMESGPEYREGGSWLLPRENLIAFCEALGEDRDTTSLCVWERHEDEPAGVVSPPGPTVGDDRG